MIKPFTVIDVKTQANGEQKVTFKVQRVVSATSGSTEMQSMTTYTTVPAGQDVDTYLFDQLSRAGWF